MRSLSWKQVNGWRLARQHLQARAERRQMVEVVRRIGALQAQLMSAAELQLWARVDDLTPDDARKALWQERSLIKTWVLRGTLHLIAAQDFPYYVAVMSEIMLKFYRRGSWLKYHLTTLEALDALVDAIDATLTDVPLSRKQLAEAVAQKAGNPALQTLLESGWGALLKPAAVQGRILFGESVGQNVTFLHPRHWIGEWQAVDTETGFREMARRYLAAYAPASVDDFGHWFGMQPADAKRAFRLLGDEIEEVDVDGWKAWALVEMLDDMAAHESAPSVRLLPYFDPYVLSASRHSQYILDDAHKTKVYRAQGWISPVVLVNGRIEGVWEHALKRGKVTVTVSLFEPVSKAIRRGVEGEAGRLGTFLGAESEVVFAP